MGRLTGEHRTGAHTIDRRVGCQMLDLEIPEDQSCCEDRAVRKLHRLDENPPVKPSLEVAPLARLVLGDSLDPDTTRAATVGLTDDELLGDVDEPAGEVAGVGGAKRRVREALSGAVR